MTYDPHDTRRIPVGTQVIALNGEVLGTVREIHAHYLLIDQPGRHLDLDVPVHAIREYTGDALHLSINREATTEVDHEETVHRHVDDAPAPEA